MMTKLQNSLVDILVKVGINEHTGLEPVPIQPECDKPYEDELYRTAFEPRILAAISADACVFPCSTGSEQCRDVNYPPTRHEIVSLGGEPAKKVKFKRAVVTEQTSVPADTGRKNESRKNGAQSPDESHTKKKDRSSLFKRFGSSKGNRESGKILPKSNLKTSQNQMKRSTRNSVKALKDTQVVQKRLADIGVNNRREGWPSSDDDRSQRARLHNVHTRAPLRNAWVKEDRESAPKNEPRISEDSNFGLINIDGKHVTGNTADAVSEGQKSAVSRRQVVFFSDEETVEEHLPELRVLDLQRTLSKKRSCRKVDFVRRDVTNGAGSQTASVINTDLPLAVDVLNSLTSLCFPDGAMCESNEPEGSVHFLVLTDVTGMRSYATCLTYYTQYSISKNGDGSYDVDAYRHCSADVTNDDACYLPSCIVLVSKLPYFLLLKDVASRLLESIRNLRYSFDIEKQVLQQTALQLCRTLAPPSGQLMLKFIYADTVFTAHAPTSYYRPVLDFSLHLLFQYLAPEKVLEILGCMLLQQRLIFLCSHYSLLTIVAEFRLLQSVLHLLYPFKWNMTYVPLLSWSILELIEAPGTFIMGCHSRYKRIIRMVEDIVIVDIDRGTVETDGTAPFPPIPQFYSADFVDRCKTALYNHDTARLNRPTKFSYDDTWKWEHARQVTFNNAVTTAALELHVSLFSGIIPHIKPEKGFFNKEKFLMGVEGNERKFYKAVMATELFSSFLKERISEKKDDWTIKEERVRSFYKCSLPLASYDALDRRRGRAGHRDMRKSSSASVSDISSLVLHGAKNGPIIVQLPAFNYFDYDTYFEHCCEVLSQSIQECSTSDRRAPFYLMLGLLRLADGKRIEALEDLQRLHSCDSRLLPDGIIREVTQSLTDDEKNALNSNSLLAKSAAYKHKPQSNRYVSVVIDFNKLPQQEMDLQQFSDLVRLLDIAVDMKVVSRLFDALIIDKVNDLRLLDGVDPGKVQPHVFEEFYKCWKEAVIACDDVTSSLTEGLDQGECVLKLSDTLKCSYGTGRIGLTQKRLFFLREGSNSYKRISLLRNIKSMEKTTQKSFFSQLPALKLDFAGNEPKTFIATVKDKQELWYSIVSEMWAGKVIAEEVRDPSIVDLAAQNVLIIDAFMVCMNDSEISGCFTHWEEKITSLCYHAEQRNGDRHVIPMDTKELLQHRINPSLLETDLCTVECLLYTPGNKSLGADSDLDPRLVCGLSNGRICIFNASNWQIEASQSISKDRVMSLLSVGQGFVWSACLDRKIYVISMETKSCHQTLRHHADAVTDLCYGSDKSVVYSCSSNGEITEWNSQTNDVTNSFHVSKYKCMTRISHSRQKLYCCTRDEVVILSTAGEIEKVLSYQDTQPQTALPVRLACLLLLPSNQLWVGCSRQGNILVYDLETLKLQQNIVIDAAGIYRMAYVNNQVWVGAKDGCVHVLDAKTYSRLHVLRAHRDAIRCICVALDRYVITGSASEDGTVMIWSATAKDNSC